MDENKDSSSNSSVEKMEEVMLPGFRFHPTDEELVGFYLRRKIQHRPLSIELIKQLDIYKYDPWDLPKMATTGEKEWYFYCPRDRKYRNSARPNRVTGAGFWKATGTDRPIYSSESSKCIGLKKSLVFYKGRAAKGIKTDWMMHEFRLPTSTINTSNSESGLTKRYMDKHIPIPANDAWAICRIFKKANSTAQRALSQSWVSPIILPAETPHDDNMQTSGGHYFHTTTSTATKTAAATASSSVIQFGESSSSHEVIQQQKQSSSSSIPTTFSPTLLDPTYNFPYTKCTISPMMMMMMSDHDHDQVSHHEVSTSKCHHHHHHDDIILNTTITPFPDTTSTITTTIDASSLLLNMSSSVFGDMGKSGKDLEFANTATNQEQYCSNFLMAATAATVGQQEQDVMRRNYFVSPSNPHDQTVGVGEKEKEKYWDSCMLQSLVGINPAVVGDDAWKSNLLWDSSSPCPSSDISTTYSTNNKCYT